MMKNLKLIVSLVCVGISIIICALMIHFSNKNFVEDVFLGSDIEETVDDYLINQGYVKAPEKSMGVWLIENYDTDFEKDSEKLQKAVDALEESVFDTVFIRSEYFSAGGEKSEYEKNLSNLENLTAILKEQGKTVFAEVCLSFDEDIMKALASLCDGVILKDDRKLSAERLNSELMKLEIIFAQSSLKTKRFLALELSYDISKLNKKAVDGISVFIDEKTDASRLTLFDKTMKMSEGQFVCTADISKSKDERFALKTLYSFRDCESLYISGLSSLKGVTKDKDGRFSAVREYIEKGIIPDIALRDLSITGYDGSTLEVNSFDTEIEVCGSNLFPAYLNGKEIDLGEKGSERFTFNLSEGENVYTFEQCSQKVEYKVNMTFDGELILSVMPGDTLIVQPKEMINVMVIAYSQADVTVKIGTKEYEAKCVDNAGTSYAAFTAKIKMPSTREEVSSLGMISVIAISGERSVQQKGAMIVCGEEFTTAASSENTEVTTTLVQPGNFVEEIIGDEYEFTTLPVITVPQVTTPSVIQPFTANQMCIITQPYADTRPLVYNDDTYVPSYSTLVSGTMDYVTAQSSAYNSEENETVYFYELASGRKVKCEHAQLVSGTQNKNSLSVVSSESTDGTVKIRLATNWKVPYAITHTPQKYFSAYGTKYNLSSFNANYIAIDFYHTTSVSGQADVSGSNVVKSASFTVSQSESKATLMMPLRTSAKYCGTSIEYDENGYMVITVHNNPQTLSGSVILLDPGHGGNDSGALGIGDQVKESDINLAVAYAVRNALQQKGATVYLTRQGNESLSLDDRKNIAYSLKPDLFVSIHSNGSPRSSDIGTSVYYYKGFSQPLAANIYNEMISVFKNNLYYGQQELYSDLADGARYYPFAVTRLEDCPSVLIETGYVTNDSECYKLIQRDTHTLFGQAIARGIEKTITG